jgi:AcrR family transcriptional regulator
MTIPFSIEVNKNSYIKNPQTSELGVKIIEEGINLLCELGFEEFTFRKLSVRINSTEASIYRYFENKHKFVLYLISWYWNWINLKLMLAISNIDDPKEKLLKAVKIITEEVKEDSNFSYINELKLQKIVISESSKSYFNKGVDEANKLGLYSEYKLLVQKISDLILENNPTFKYPHMLVTTVIEGSYHQRYFSKHLPRLTDDLEGEDSIEKFFIQLIIKTIN